MSQNDKNDPETGNVTSMFLRYCSCLPGLTILPVSQSQMTTTSGSTSHRKESPTPVIAQGLSLPCIQKLLRKRTVIWLKDGRRMLRESSSSCVLIFTSKHQIHAYQKSYRPVYSLRW